MLKKKSEKTKASFLCLPMLNQDYKYFDFSGKFVNAYIKFEGKEDLDSHLFLLYQYPDLQDLDPDDLEKMLALESKLQTDLGAGKYIETIDISKTHIVVIYEIIKEEYLKELNIFKSSKYSQLSPKYKEEIIKFHNPINSAAITSVLSRDKRMLMNIHRELGCKKEICNCKKDTNDYIVCKHFAPFNFDLNTSECWGEIDDKEILTKDKYEARDKTSVK